MRGSPQSFGRGSGFLKIFEKDLNQPFHLTWLHYWLDYEVAHLQKDSGHLTIFKIIHNFNNNMTVQTNHINNIQKNLPGTPKACSPQAWEEIFGWFEERELYVSLGVVVPKTVATTETTCFLISARWQYLAKVPTAYPFSLIEPDRQKQL